MLQKLKTALLALHRDERGAMSVEKVLILAIIALPLLVVLYLFRQKIESWFSDQSNKLDNKD